ncbi:MAG: hypothetical protein HY736_06565 [Verrucomicrobia bacterium]|nr:hypothetical protein [Verrucomicrobiota bacterium]
MGFLTKSTEAVLNMLGLGKEVDAPPSEEEVSHLIEQGAAAVFAECTTLAASVTLSTFVERCGAESTAISLRASPHRASPPGARFRPA